MTAQVVSNTMSHHPFPLAFSSPVATPSPTKESQFPLFPQNPPPPSDIPLAGSASEAGPSKPSVAATPSSNRQSEPRKDDIASARTYRGPGSRRTSRPRLRSLQSLNSAPASPSLTEQDSGRAYISTSRLHSTHQSLSRGSSRNAVETLQPLAESSVSAGKLKADAHNQIWTNDPTGLTAASPQRWTSNHAEGNALPPRARRSSTSPKLDTGLSEFGQMGAPFAEHTRNGDRNDVSAKLRNLHTSTGAFLRRSHTITTGISSASQKKPEDAPLQQSPPSSALTYGPSSGKTAPKLTQRRQTVSNVSPRAGDSLTGGQTGATASMSPPLSRATSYKQPSPHPASGSSLSVSSPPSRIRERGTLPNNQLEAKVVILGSQGVGKTSLVHRYTSGQFAIASTPSTIGASFLTKKLIVDGVKVRLQLWDTAGQERFRSMAPMYYRGSHAAVIVYDITSMSSFMDVRAWVEELKKNMTTDLVIHVVGAKLDLAWSQRQVDLDFARAKVRSWLQPYQTQLTPSLASGYADSDGSPVSPTRPSSRLGGLGSLAIGSASRFAAFQRSSSPSWPQIASGSTAIAGTATMTTAAAGGLKPSSFGSSRASSGSAGSDGDRDTAMDLEQSGSGLSWEVVELSEVSAKDDRGIEEVFLAVTKKLVERRSQIEQERADRERNSIFLSSHDADHLMTGINQPAITPNSWTCCG